MFLLPTSVRMVMMSHLSDLQIEMTVQNPGKEFYMHTKLNFVKYLLNKYPDITTEIIPDEEWEKFRNEHAELTQRDLKDSKEELIDALKDFENAMEVADKVAGFPVKESIYKMKRDGSHLTPVLVTDPEEKEMIDKLYSIWTPRKEKEKINKQFSSDDISITKEDLDKFHNTLEKLED